MSDQQLSVVLVDDDAIVRNWLRDLLAGTEFRLAGEASNLAEARSLVPRRLPDLVLVDYRLPDGLGTELVRDLRKQRQRLRALVLTANPKPGLNEAARAAGAYGSALKTGRSSELLAALRAVATGATAFDSRHPRRPAARAPLSPRECEVLRLVAAGSTNRETAAALGLRPETVKTLLGRCFAKLGVSRRAEAVAAAYGEGILLSAP